MGDKRAPARHQVRQDGGVELDHVEAIRGHHPVALLVVLIVLLGIELGDIAVVGGFRPEREVLPEVRRLASVYLELGIAQAGQHVTHDAPVLVVGTQPHAPAQLVQVKEEIFVLDAEVGHRKLVQRTEAGLQLVQQDAVQGAHRAFVGQVGDIAALPRLRGSADLDVVVLEELVLAADVLAFVTAGQLHARVEDAEQALDAWRHIVGQ